MTDEQEKFKKLPELHVVGRVGSIYMGALLGASLVLLVMLAIYTWHLRTKESENAGH